jgi:short-subunit dehydrogenase
VWGVIHGVHLFTPMMLEAAKADPAYRGHIVNTASMAGLLTPPNMGVYNVTKHAVVSLTETLYQDLALVTDQISASVLCPYFVPTGINSSERNRPAHMADEKPTKSQLIGQAMTNKAVGSGKVSAADVAQKVFDAVQSGQFYIYSHPHALGNVQLHALRWGSSCARLCGPLTEPAQSGVEMPLKAVAYFVAQGQMAGVGARDDGAFLGGNAPDGAGQWWGEIGPFPVHA